MFQLNELSDKISALEEKITRIENTGTGFIKIHFLITRNLKEPLDAVVEPDGDGFIARTTDIPLYGFGDDPIEATGALKYEIESLWNDLTEDDEFAEEWLKTKEFLKERIEG
ncbi:hypothetical protein QUF80_15070 [Desulfococcaceae bacterium HSG8]|nr:hypothetical protein [Desulfococcaceae bacterium HSG8]